MTFIAFLTDWGISSYYVGVAKSVMKQINPQAEIIDITHDIEPFNIHEAMYILQRAFPDFPPRTVFCAVVDYGVGTERLPIAIKLLNGSFLVGPGNGIFTLLVEQYQMKKAVILQNPNYFYHPTPSTTFHGRDIFAPVSAHLSLGIPIENLGPYIESITLLPVTHPVIQGDILTGEIAFCDRFGNIETNIPGHLLESMGIHPGDHLTIKIGENSCDAIFSAGAYGSIERGQVLIHTDSSGFVEIAVNQGSAKDILLHNNFTILINIKKMP
jgi:hypothetical protein